MINDNRGNGEVVVVFWLASPLIPPSAAQAARDMLDKYTVIGVTHAHTSKDGTITTDRSATLEAGDGQGKPLQMLDVDSMPPTVVGALATVKSMFARSLGAFGQGMQFFVFASGAVNACTKGGMYVQFANEKYTYVTPVPGCPTT